MTEPIAMIPAVPTLVTPTKLDAPLYEINLPTRLRNWANRKALLTVRDLVLIDPASLLDEDYLGKKSIADAKHALQSWLGVSWEACRFQLLGVPPKEGATGDAVRRTLSIPTGPWAEKLDAPIFELDLPTRLRNWIEKKKSIVSVRDLVLVDARALMDEDNLGRKSVADGKKALQSWLGISWEEARDVLLSTPEGQENADWTPTPSPGVEGHERRGYLLQKLGWVAETTLDALRALPLNEVELPTRVMHLIEQHGWLTLGELLDLPQSNWVGVPGISRGSIGDTIEALQGEVTRISEGRLSSSGTVRAAPTLLEAWSVVLAALPANERMILSRRTGVSGEPATLKDVGDILGISRERVRQLEVRALSDGRFVGALSARIRTSLDSIAQGQAFWWENASDVDSFSPLEKTTPLVGFLLDRGFGGGWRFAIIEGQRLAYRSSTGDDVTLDKAWDDEVLALQEHTYPVAWRALREEIVAAGDAVAPGVGDCWRELVERSVHLDVPDGAVEPMAMSFGEDRRSEILAILRASPKAMRIEAVQAALGRRVRLPAEVMYVGRGLVGLEQHFPDMASWRERLVPPCVGYMAESAERQWSAFELHGLLREEVELPAWLDAWHLCALLQRADGVDYLGRMRMRLRDTTTVDRIPFRDATLDLLREAGKPIAEKELFRRLTERTSFQELTLRLMLTHAPFLRVNATHWGLFDRDLPGGQEAVTTACDEVVRCLEARQDGMSLWEAQQVVCVLSKTHASWAQELVISALRSDSRIAIAKGGRGLGLSSWTDGPRTLTRAQHVEKLVTDAGGTLSVTDVLAFLSKKYGIAVRRVLLGTMLNGSTLRVDKDVVRTVEGAIDEPAAEDL